MSPAASPYARWDAFLAQTHEAFDQLMWDGRASCLELLDLLALNPDPMARQWIAVRAAVFELVERVSRTWRELEPAFEAADPSGETLVTEASRGRLVGQRLLHELERMEIEVFAEAAEKLLHTARSSLAKSLRCSHCGAPVPLPERLFRAALVRCPCCSATGHFEPPLSVRKLEPFCLHHVSQREAISEWALLATAQRDQRTHRASTPPDRLESATRGYWEAYFVARARLTGATASEVERDVAAQMRRVGSPAAVAS